MKTKSSPIRNGIDLISLNWFLTHRVMCEYKTNVIYGETRDWDLFLFALFLLKGKYKETKK